jgi:hypothetical protein
VQFETEELPKFSTTFSEKSSRETVLGPSSDTTKKF